MLLSNTGWRTNINDIGLHMVDPGYPVKPQRRAVPLDAAQLERLVGRYKAAPFTVAVTQEGTRLFAKVGNNPMFEVFAASQTEFFYRVVAAGPTFELGPDSHAAAVVLHGEDKKEFRGRRM